MIDFNIIYKISYIIFIIIIIINSIINVNLLYHIFAIIFGDLIVKILKFSFKQILGEGIYPIIGSIMRPPNAKDCEIVNFKFLNNIPPKNKIGKIKLLGMPSGHSFFSGYFFMYIIKSLLNINSINDIKKINKLKIYE